MSRSASKANMEWLNTLTDQQIMALAAQNDLLGWAKITIHELKTTLAKLDNVTQQRMSMKGRTNMPMGVCCGEETEGGEA